MTHLKAFIFLALLCALSSAQEFNPGTGFDIERILNNPWYSVAWFNTLPDNSSSGCTSYQFVRSSYSNQISYEYSYNYPSITGSLNFGIYSLIPTDNTRVFDVTDNPIPRKFNILAYDEDNYDWLVIGDSASQDGPWIDLLVRDLSNDNTAGVNKAEEEATKYGLDVRHDVDHSACDYDSNREQLAEQKEEQVSHAQFFTAGDFDVTNIENVAWYSIVWYNTKADSQPYGCSAYLFTPIPGSNQISYDYSYNYPGITGSTDSNTYTLEPTDNSRVFDVVDSWFTSRSFNILDYDEDYNWIVIGDTGVALDTPWVDLLVRNLSNDNSEGISAIQEQAAKYGFGARHNVNHDSTCSYEALNV